MSNSYKTQDRGSASDYQKYMASMDKVITEKVASASLFFDPSPGNTIVDIGMASGASSNIIANLFPHTNVIGIDINPTMVELAQNNYSRKNLEFRADDGETLQSFKENSVNGFFNCSSIHHITSFNQYNPNRAFNTIKREAELLKPGGVIVIRDFVKAPQMEVILEVSSIATATDPSNADLLIQFSKTARSLAPKEEQGFPIKEVESKSENTRCFQLYYADAVEFVRRKDYYENWNVELQEEYGYFTQKEFEEIFTSLGLRIIVSNPIFNPWIVENRYKDQFTIYNMDGEDIGFPPTNYLIAAEKIGDRGTNIHLVRHLPELKQAFLDYSTHQNTSTKHLYDVVKRPQSVVDIIPYYIHNNEVEILAKHGYPRPLVNVETDSPIIDQKRFSGYITEGITASKDLSIQDILSKRINLDKADIENEIQSLEYYPSPGGIEEKVESFFVKLNERASTDFPINTTANGFSDLGLIRRFNAIQLLKTAQTGALVEARLELNLYNLLKSLNIPFPQWLGGKITYSEFEVIPTPLAELLKVKTNFFVKCSESANYLQKSRAKFGEKSSNESSDILEYVSPQHVSLNTLITLPLVKQDEEYFVGLEVRNLPVPQILSGNSTILTAPAQRLPKQISSFKALENHILNTSIFGSQITKFSKLGEKFFPSVGVTPEQAYPYVVELTHNNDTLKWVKLTELYKNIELIRDGHLLISIFRLVNALGLR
ncbi:methyltransferase domain-containing protein [Labilibaculum sp. DW002]|uniref:Methyltransferase domain-containing protein n=1 Tax=Paralabilibaculum antarcticum TaxID=2912572 RepID=A0ABT5VMS8_9BACT|nr:class I SAM-dependent methyltransferase [Labilibaculum sp. DW002]MDE5416750.1 methyltransferase domain-containing protein [Labilibaculum sp. DW002]